MNVLYRFFPGVCGGGLWELGFRSPSGICRLLGNAHRQLQQMPNISRVLVTIHTLASELESSLCPTSLPILGINSFFFNFQADTCEIITHRALKFDFPDYAHCIFYLKCILVIVA